MVSTLTQLLFADTEYVCLKVRCDKPDPRTNMEVTLQESSTAASLKNLLIALKFPKPPANITAEVLFGKVLNKVSLKL